MECVYLISFVCLTIFQMLSILSLILSTKLIEPMGIAWVLSEPNAENDFSEYVVCLLCYYLQYCRIYSLMLWKPFFFFNLVLILPLCRKFFNCEEEKINDWCLTFDSDSSFPALTCTRTFNGSFLNSSEKWFK